jgi:O-antigen ligase
MRSSPADAGQEVGDRPSVVSLGGNSADAPRRIEISVARILQLSLFALVIGNLGRIPVLSTGTREAPLLINDVAVFAFLLWGAIAAAVRRSLRIDSVAAAGLLFAAVGALSAVLAVPRFGLSAFELFVSLAYLARWVFYFGIYIVVTNSLRRADVPQVLRSLEIAILCFAGFGILQSIFLPGFAQMVYPDARVYIDWDYQGRRLVSTFLDPNFAGALIMFGLSLQMARMAGGARVAHWKPLLLTVALLFTASRSSILGMFVAGAIIISIRGLSRRLLHVVLAAAVVLAAMSPVLLRYAIEYNKLQLDASAVSRFVRWMQALQVFAENPIIGIGFNTWGFVTEKMGFERLGSATYAVEGGLLFIAVTTGVVGLAAFGWMLSRVIARARRVWRDASQRSEDRSLAAGTAAATVGLVVHSLFTNSLLLPLLIEPLFVLWGCVAVVAATRPPPVETVTPGSAARSPLRLGTVRGRGAVHP